MVHGQRGRFGTHKRTEVSFWYIKKSRGVILVLKKGRGVILVHKKGQRCCFGAGYVRGVVSVHTCMLHYPDLNTKLLSIKKYEV